MKQMLMALGLAAALGVGAVAQEPRRLPERPKGPRASVTAYASVDAVVPGQSFDVALAFKIVPGWHIYWQNPGDSGMSPRVHWTGPEGFTAGAIQFPVPKVHRDAGGLLTNILEGEPVLIVSVQAPASLGGEKVALKAKVNYLVCEAACLQESANLTIELPVAAAGGSAKAANEELFAAARRVMPKTSSKYVTVTPELPSSTLTKGQIFEYVVKVKVKPGHHIQSDKPLSPQFIATSLFLEADPAILWKPAVFPPAKERQVPGVGRVSEFAGEVVIRVAGEAYEDVAEAKRLGGLLTYQACTDQGTCFSPETVAFSFADGPGPQRIPFENASAAGGESPGAAPVEEGSAEASPGTGPAGGAAQAAMAAKWEAIPLDVVRVGESVNGQPTVLLTILFAFLGGLILNIMPCVLPVISIKILSFVQQAGESPRRVFLLGLTFAAGIVVSFEALAAVAIVLQSVGESAGWGSQFQSPGFVIFMAAVMFVFGLSLFGVFEVILPGSAANRLSVAETKEGFVGAFFKGVLATVLATPCTAPFLGSAMGVAFASPRPTLVAIFTAAGLGMALPYILLTAHPAWMKYLPRPGTWMEHFKEFMGFLLMGTFVWLMVILGDLIGGAGVAYTLAFLTFLGAACWLMGKSSPMLSLPRRATIWTMSLMLVACGWFVSYRWLFTLERGESERHRVEKQAEFWAQQHPDELYDLVDYDHTIPWKRWWKWLPRELASQGYTVYVDYTATWCATCQTNKNLTLLTDDVRRKMKELKIIPIKADYTNSDPEMFAELQKYGRAGVPTNVIFPACDPNKALLLPEQLVGRADLIIEQLEAAGLSRGEACEVQRTAMAD